jgi:hypothetical protein
MRLTTTQIVVLRRIAHLGVSRWGEDLGMLNLLDDVTDLPADRALAGRFEPCHALLRDHAGSPVCGDCGWLDGEHTAGANVRRLPRRTNAARRLAS